MRATVPAPAASAALEADIPSTALGGRHAEASAPGAVAATGAGQHATVSAPEESAAPTAKALPAQASGTPEVMEPSVEVAPEQKVRELEDLLMAVGSGSVSYGNLPKDLLIALVQEQLQVAKGKVLDQQQTLSVALGDMHAGAPAPRAAVATGVGACMRRS